MTAQVLALSSTILYLIRLKYAVLISDDDVEFNFGQLLNTSIPIIFTVLGTDAVVRFEQPSNAQSSIVVTEFGIVIVLSDLQLENAYFPIIFSEFERDTDLSLVQEAKAARPIEVTELGIVTDTRFSHS